MNFKNDEGRPVFDTNDRTKASGVHKKLLNFDFIASIYFMKSILYKVKVLTEMLESPNLNVIDVIIITESCIRSFKAIRESEDDVDNVIEAAACFAKNLDIDAEADFQRHHRLKNIYGDLQVKLNMKQFYRK